MGKLLLVVSAVDGQGELWSPRLVGENKNKNKKIDRKVKEIKMDDIKRKKTSEEKKIQKSINRLYLYRRNQEKKLDTSEGDDKKRNSENRQSKQKM